jgi:rubrerythrin
MIKSNLNRRDLIGGGTIVSLSITAMAALTGLGSSSAFAKTKTAAEKASEKADADVLNQALAAEFQAIAAYQVGAESGLLKKPALALALQFQGHHKAHADLLHGTIEELGGKPATALKTYNFPLEKLKTDKDVLRFAAGLEQGAVSAYLTSVAKFTDRNLAKAAASVLGDEAMHWAVLLNVLGENPVPQAFVV